MPSHGSLSKAGKIRHHTNTPHHQKKWREEQSRGIYGLEGKRYRRKKKHPCPRVSNRKAYLKLIRKKRNKSSTFILG